MEESYIAKRITQLRMARNISEYQMSLELGHSKSYIQTYPRLMFYPGILIMIIVLAFNYLGEGIQNGTAKK